MKTITLKKDFTVLTHPNGSVEVVLNAENVLKNIGAVYGLYSYAEDNYNSRVALSGVPELSALEVQENIAYHGSPCWDTINILTTDKEQIDAYMQFREILKYIKQKGD